MQRCQQQQRQRQQRKQQFEQCRRQNSFDQKQQPTEINQQQLQQPTQINYQHQQQPTHNECQQQMVHQQQHKTSTYHQGVLPNLLMDTSGLVQENVPITANDCSGLINVIQNLDLNDSKNGPPNRNFTNSRDNGNVLQPCTSIGNEGQRGLKQQPQLHDQQHLLYINEQQQQQAAYVEHQQQLLHHQQPQNQQQYESYNLHQTVFQNLFVDLTGSMQDDIPVSGTDFFSQINVPHVDLNDEAQGSLNPNCACTTPKNNDNGQQPIASMENEHQLLVLTHRNSNEVFSVDE